MTCSSVTAPSATSKSPKRCFNCGFIYCLLTAADVAAHSRLHWHLIPVATTPVDTH
ncbi:hypothetical protein HER31_14070 [Ferrimonas lipolytica]|uniref:Uncharacterized protein n=1 Tax=Ferrimonas lipolytica TaxID=2724191 RepID=A0A6H1UJB6_9GAMM|nr:hypothetical protein HER31_14070 [Ferrimonas lipolytica]